MAMVCVLLGVSSALDDVGVLVVEVLDGVAWLDGVEGIEDIEPSMLVHRLFCLCLPCCVSFPLSSLSSFYSL